MNARIKAYLPKLNDCGGDLSKDWFVYFSYRNSENKKMVRFKEHKGFAQLKTKTDRYQFAKVLIRRLTRRLRTGWDPFIDSDVIYETGENDKVLLAKGNSIAVSLEKVLKSVFGGDNPKSLQNYMCYLNNFYNFLHSKNIADHDISAIDENIAEEFLLYITEIKKLTNKSRNEHLSLFKRLFSVLLRKKIISENPFEFCINKKHYKKPPEYFRDQIRTVILDDIEQNDPQLTDFIQLTYYTMRRSTELRKLRVRNVNMEQAVIVFDEELAKTDEQEKIDIPLQLYKRLVEMELHKYPDDFFILTIEGKPGPKQIGKNYFYKRWKKYRDKYGLTKRYGLYNWKHTAAVTMIAKGFDPKAIQEHAGWSSLEMVENYTKSYSLKGSTIMHENFPDIRSQTAIKQFQHSPIPMSPHP